MIISGRVYDLTEFAHLHPGGLKIIRSYPAWMRPKPTKSAPRCELGGRCDAGMYEIGAVRRLDFGQVWSVAISPARLHFLPSRTAIALGSSFST